MKKYDIYILLAGCTWGVIGLFTRNLSLIGVTSGGVLVIRSTGCLVLFAVWALVKDPKLFRFQWKDAWLLLLFGLVTFAFTYCYYQSIDLGSLSAACTLMYSAPVFVMVMSLFIFKEKFSRRKLMALLLAVAGCTLVSGVPEGDSTLSTAGVVYGLLAGIGYAGYSVCIKALSNRGLDTLTINVYGWLVCSLAGLATWGFSAAAPVMQSGATVLLGIGLIVISGFLPALLYSMGLKGEEAGKGAVMASIEPVVASLAGFVAFHEAPTPLAVLGVALVLAAVVLLNTSAKNTHKG